MQRAVVLAILTEEPPQGLRLRLGARTGRGDER